jgi:hypothetical protein
MEDLKKTMGQVLQTTPVEDYEHQLESYMARLSLEPNSSQIQ